MKNIFILDGAIHIECGSNLDFNSNYDNKSGICFLFETHLSVDLGEALPVLSINYKLWSPKNSFHIWLLVMLLRFMNS